MGNELSRRNFLKGAGLAALGTAAASGLVATGCSSELADTGADWMPEWTDEADLIIVGYGGCGATAAIAAVDAGVSAIVLEKSSERDGGSTGCSGGHIHTCAEVDVDEWWNTFSHGAFGTVRNEDDMKEFLAKSQELPAWCEQFGINIDWVDESNDGHKRPKEYQGGYVAGRDGIVGMYLFEELDEVADGYGVDVRLSNRATRLIQNPVTREICGVTAQGPDGEELNYKARRAVLLCCGGYENNPWIQYNYNNPGVRVYGWGTPNNEGDGFALAQSVGADIWHMHGLEWAALCYKQPSEIANCSISTDATDGITPYNYLIVDYNGERFMKEDRTGAHDMEHINGLDFDAKACDYRHLPFFLVFDQAFFDAKPLWEGSGRAGIINTYAGVWNFHHPDDPLFEWGSNENAVEQGWLFKGDTLEELAANIKADRPCKSADEAINGIDGEALAATVARYNEYALAGEDPDWGRDPKHMLPLGDGPYYAIELGFSSINTQGGPVRNHNCQTMTPAYEPIPRLYNCGEFGSFNGFVYGLGNIFEALSTGIIAAQHAITLDPWDTAE